MGEKDQKSDQDLSRREMLRSRFGIGLIQSIGYAMGQAQGVRKQIERAILDPVPPMEPVPAGAVFHRPPGAIDEISFAAQCTKCQACVKACPSETLVPLTGVFGKAFETPVVDPLIGGCTMCSDHACASACFEEGVGVIDSMLPMKMGHATVHRSSCQSHIGEECSLCIDVCPIKDVIKHDWRKIPAVNKDLCTGCGLCVHACPVEPAAISIIPLRERLPKPTQPSQDQNKQEPSAD